MTHPLIGTLNDIKRQEAGMTDEANDRREGYADGMAGRWHQLGRSGDYLLGWRAGDADASMLDALPAEWKRRHALPEVAA